MDERPEAFGGWAGRALRSPSHRIKLFVDPGEYEDALRLAEGVVGSAEQCPARSRAATPGDRATTRTAQLTSTRTDGWRPSRGSTASSRTQLRLGNRDTRTEGLPYPAFVSRSALAALGGIVLLSGAAGAASGSVVVAVHKATAVPSTYEPTAYDRVMTTYCCDLQALKAKYHSGQPLVTHDLLNLKRDAAALQQTGDLDTGRELTQTTTVINDDIYLRRAAGIAQALQSAPSCDDRSARLVGPVEFAAGG